MLNGQLNKFAEEVFNLAKDKGWWEKDRSFGEIVALIHSEVSEALEEWRGTNQVLYYVKDNNGNDKPEGVGIELADTIIRILDWCHVSNIDIEEMLRIKHTYNKTREYKHGGKRA